MDKKTLLSAMLLLAAVSMEGKGGTVKGEKCKGLGRSGYFFAYQFTDDLDRQFVVRIRPCPDIIGGNLVQFVQQFPLAGKHTAAFGRVHPGRVSGVVLVKSIIFFVSHVGHRVLLPVEQMIKDTPALHGMEYLRGSLIKLVIEYLQQIAVMVKAQDDTPGAVIFQRAFIFGGSQDATDILAVHPVLKGRRGVDNPGLHASRVTQKSCGGNTGEEKGVPIRPFTMLIHILLSNTYRTLLMFIPGTIPFGVHLPGHFSCVFPGGNRNCDLCLSGGTSMVRRYFYSLFYGHKVNIA
jgi:hypothetical protein